MGNTVGSKSFLRTAEDYYCLGLWLADGYWRASSIGLTSVDPELIRRFAIFLQKKAPHALVKRRIYHVKKGEKRRQVAVQMYINNRPLTRQFMAYKTLRFLIPVRFRLAYLAGRIDGDGSVDTVYRSGIRIAYSSREDAQHDQYIFGKNNVSLYHYRAARTYVLYLRKKYRDVIMQDLRRISVKLAP